MRNKRKAALLAGVLGVVLGVGLVSGCAPTAGSTTTDSAKAAEQRTPQPAVTGLGAVVAAPDKPEFIQANRTATLPEVATDDEGVQYQRTPSEYPESKAYYWPQETLDGSYAYNIMSLDADNRGCNACHEDLGETIQMLGYPTSICATNTASR